MKGSGYMEKIKFSQEFGITITKIRLLTIEEYEKHKDKMPTANLYDSRLLSYLLDAESMPSNDFTEIGVLCYSDGKDTYSRVALELTDVEKNELDIGNEFVFEGKFYTLLDKNLAVSSGFARNYEFE